MRLSILKNGHTLLQKIQIFMIKSGMDFLPGPVATLSYRKNFFGKHYNAWLHQTMREAKHWSIGELELFAAFVSRKNECQYCVNDHRAVVKIALDEKIVDAVLKDYLTAPIDEKTRETLRFLEKLTLTPGKLTEADILPMKEKGLSDEAIEEAIHVCAVFCIINRLADAFDFELAPDPNKTGQFLYKNGYKGASLWG